MHPRSTFLLLATLSTLPTVSNAQSPLETASALFVKQCPGLISKLTEGPAFVAATKARPVSVDTVCSCTGARIQADARLKNYFDTDEATLKRRLQSPDARSYMTLRAMEAALSCLVPELESSVGAIDLPL